jgi:hypothetical protein
METQLKQAATQVERHVGKQRRCPRCGSLRLYPSQGRGAGEKLLAAIGGELRRCHSCRARVCWFGLASIQLGENAKEGSLSSGVIVLVGCMVCIALLWWMIARITQAN